MKEVNLNASGSKPKIERLVVNLTNTGTSEVRKLEYDVQKLSGDSGSIVRSTGGGLIIPFVSPAVSAASSGGVGVATNEGNSDAPVVLEFVGPLTNPYVLNQTSGLFMQLSPYTIPAATIVRVDTKDNTILIDGGGSLIDKKADGASFFPLLPGPNDIVFSTDDSSDTGYLRLRWRNASISL